MKYILFFIAAFIAFSLTGCADYNGGIWQKQMWLAPLLTGIGSMAFGITAIRSHKSGAEDGGAKIKYTQLWSFWFSVALALATIGIFIAVNASK